MDTERVPPRPADHMADRTIDPQSVDPKRVHSGAVRHQSAMASGGLPRHCRRKPPFENQ